MKPLLFPAFLLLVGASVRADVVMSYEGPDVENTPIAGATTETFNEISLYPVTGSSSATGQAALPPFTTPIGTFSAGGIVIPADQYGGAGGTGNYFAVGTYEWDPSGSGVFWDTLTLNTPANYVGIYGTALDGSNDLYFYDGNALVGSFDPDMLGDNDYSDYNPITGNYGQNVFSSAYYDNPDNPGGDPSEPFAYLNFTTTGSTQITSVVFADFYGGGFELDNVSVASGTITPPGTLAPAADQYDFIPPSPVSDRATTLILLAAALAALFAAQMCLESASSLRT